MAGITGSPCAFLRRLRLAVAMTLEYGGRFPRRKMFKLYWRQAAKL